MPRTSSAGSCMPGWCSSECWAGWAQQERVCRSSVAACRQLEGFAHLMHSCAQTCCRRRANGGKQVELAKVLESQASRLRKVGGQQGRGPGWMRVAE